MGQAGVCRWGILGAASIARKNWQAIALAGNARVVAVASRELERAQGFIDSCQTEVPVTPPCSAFGSYDELIADPDIDALYIPLPTGLRKPWVLKAAAAGKHVLVEKPVGTSATDVEEMVAACDRHGVQFMDGVLFMHSRRMDELRRSIDDTESLGQIRRIASQFSFNGGQEFLGENIRVHSDLEPHGCLGDLGWYTIRFALWVMNYALPIRVSGRLIAQARREDSHQPVPLEFSAEMFFTGGVSASFYCSFQTENQQWVNVSGTKGFLDVRDFVLPFAGERSTFRVTNSHFNVQGCRFDMEERSREFVVDEMSNNHLSAQETRMFRHFSQLVLDGRREPVWGEIALKTQAVLDACYASALADGAWKTPVL